MCAQNQLLNPEFIGLKPIFSTIPFRNYFTGIVPRSLRFKLVKNLNLSYMGFVTKKGFAV
jgi:2-polyprenyl-6-hydroxyphenyl methylase/3-demethylubiquinone-9 3-methyltransferase